MHAGLLGMIATPAAGNRVQPGWWWCADNSAYTGRYPGDDAYLAWLARHRTHADRCAFATAPDVPLNAAATLARSRPMLPRIRALGYPAALVAQDGLQQLAVDFNEFDVLFLGGSTAWKLGPAATDLAHQARSHGLAVHVGRVNSRRRLAHAAAIGCQSVDGTHLAFAPDRNLPRLLAWLSALDASHAAPTRRRTGDPDRALPKQRATQQPVRPPAPLHRPRPVRGTTNPSQHRTEPPAVRHDHPTPTTTKPATSTEVWTEARIRALGAVTDLPTAGAVFGIGRAMSYELARTGGFPVPVIRVGARYRVPVAGILTTLGLPAGDLTSPAKRSVDHHHEISSPHRLHTTPDTGQGAS